MDYKEKLRLAKEALESGSYDKDTIEYIFPELYESEDDVIRKAIIKLVKQSSEILDKQNQNNMITWLEKQKEYESTDFEYVWNRTDCGDLTSALDKYSEEAIINMCHAWYDKGIELERKSWLEKQGNLKSDEWKEGDVVRHGGVLALVTNGRRAIKSNLEQITIQYPDEWVKAETKERKYFFDELEKQGEHKRFRDCIQIGDKVTRNEAGELVNISQLERIAKPRRVKHADKVEQKSQRMVSAEAKEALYNKPTDEEMKELLRTEYEKGRADTIAEMKSSWSEKDEKVIAIINNALTESNTPPDDYDKVYDWLESLKQRIGE